MLYLSRRIYATGSDRRGTRLQRARRTTRLRILGLLAAGEICVCHIHESLKVSQPKASRHLAYLRTPGSWTRAGMVCGFTTGWPGCPIRCYGRSLSPQRMLSHMSKRSGRIRHACKKKTGCCAPGAAVSTACPAARLLASCPRRGLTMDPRIEGAQRGDEAAIVRLDGRETISPSPLFRGQVPCSN